MKLVFIHGAGGDSSVFAAQTSAFANSVAFNLPGHSRDGFCDSVGAFADDVAHQLEHMGLSDVVLVGSSMGGAIALELALRKHPAVRGVALLGSGAKLRVAPAIFDSIDADFPAAAKMLSGYFFAAPTELQLKSVVALMLSVGQKQTKVDFAACNAFDVSDRVHDIRIPLLALTGERDMMTPPKFADFLGDRVPGAQTRIVSGAGHLLFIERPAETNEALRAFVSQIA